jgi:hypothetical protein
MTHRKAAEFLGSETLRYARYLSNGLAELRCSPKDAVAIPPLGGIDVTGP